MVDWNTINTWLWTDAGAGWIFGGLSFIVFITKSVYDYIKRSKPNIVICKELDKFSLIRINKKVKENIILKYKNSEIKNLSQIEMEFFNDGDETIRGLNIQVTFEKETKVLDVVTTKTSDISGRRHITNNVINFELPYLNPYKDHQSKIVISIVCDGKIDDLNITGGGDGWSLIHKKLPSKRQTKIRLILVLTLLLVECLFFLFLNLHSNIEWKPKLQDVIFTLLFFSTYIGGFIWALPYSSKKMLEIFEYTYH